MANTGKARKGLSKVQAKTHAIDMIRDGHRVSDVLTKIGRSTSWWELQRREDKAWASRIDQARNMARGKVHLEDPDPVLGSLPPFEVFSKEYLNCELFAHHLNMLDMIEGREPRFLHESMVYEPGTAGARRVLLTVPPNHAKTTLMINYVTWRILADPNISVLLVSKTKDMSAKLLYAIKNRLTHPRYARLQREFGPTEGFKASADMWTQHRLYLGDDVRDTGSKDPTVEALGLGSQIYGARASLILLDDVATLGNASEYEKQDSWLRQEASTRLGPGGQLIIVGTRVAPMDLYRHLRDEKTYTDGQVPWSYLAMPSVLEQGAVPEETKTLWPVSDEPFNEGDAPVSVGEDGTNYYTRWTPTRLSRVRNEVGPKRWSLIYMNADVADDATFDALCVRASVDGARAAGPLPNREGWNVLIGVDPAIAGQAGLCVYAVHRPTGQRQVLDIRSLMAPTPKRLKTELFELTETYNPNEVIVETNAYQGALAADEEITQFMATRGVVLRPQHTGREKLDPEMGVASMSALFGTRTEGQVGSPSKHNADNLLTLPRTHDTRAAVTSLVEELVAWNPEIPVKRRRQDLLMAMWFCETRARELIIRAGSGASHFVNGNSFISARDRKRQVVINLNDYAAQMNDRAAWL